MQKKKKIFIQNLTVVTVLVPFLFTFPPQRRKQERTSLSHSLSPPSSAIRSDIGMEGATEEPIGSAATAIVDQTYEFLAPRWFDFVNGETEDEARRAELWFASALSCAPSREYLRLIARSLGFGIVVRSGVWSSDLSLNL